MLKTRKYVIYTSFVFLVHYPNHYNYNCIKYQAHFVVYEVFIKFR